MEPRNQVLEVWGDLACFSRPELKVERFSYPLITPSAARGVFDAIFCKPNADPEQAEFRWQIRRIEVLSPPSYIALRRNEVEDKVSVTNVERWIKRREPPVPLYADADSQRTQRQTMALRNVRYRLHASILPWPRFEDRLQGLEAQFRRRASRGQCFYQPYMGLREFPAYFELVEIGAPMPAPVGWSSDLGFMLYDVFDLSHAGSSHSEPFISLFRAEVREGVLEVPAFDSDAVLKPERKAN